LIRRKSSRIAHRWGIVFGALGTVLVALLSVLFPQIGALWQVLSVLLVLIVVRSLLGYSFPAPQRAQSKRRRDAAGLR